MKYAFIIFFSLLYLSLGICNSTAGDIDSAKIELSKNPTNLKLKHNLAVLLYKNKEYEEVIKLLKSDADILTRPTLFLLAKTYGEAKDTTNQSRIYNRLIALNPNDYEAFVALGNFELNQRHFAESIKNYRLALNLKPHYAPAIDGLLQGFKAVDNRYEIRLTIQDLIKINGEKPEYILELCRINTLDGFHDLAVKYCKEGIRKSPEAPENYLFLAYLDKTLGNINSLVRLLKYSIKKFPQVDFVITSYGITLFEQKDFGSAEKYFKKAIELNSESFDAQIGLALSGFESKDYDVSAQAYKKACAIEPYKTVRELKKSTNSLRHNSIAKWSDEFETILESCTPANFKRLPAEARNQIAKNSFKNTPFTMPLSMDPTSLGPPKEQQKKSSDGSSIFKGNIQNNSNLPDKAADTNLPLNNSNTAIPTSGANSTTPGASLPSTSAPTGQAPTQGASPSP